MGRKSGAIPWPLSRDADLDLPVASGQTNIHLTSGRGEFDGVGQQVADDLLKPRKITAQGPLPGVEQGDDGDVLGVRGRI